MKKTPEFHKRLERVKDELVTDIQFRGHYCVRHMDAEELQRLVDYVRNDMIGTEIMIKFVMQMAETEGKDLDDFSFLVGQGINHYGGDCHECGKRVNYEIIQTKKGLRLRATSRCRYPNGYPEYTVKLKVPSGEILLFNDLRSAYGELPNRVKFNLNTTTGDAAYTRAYARRGLATVCVGNTSPDVHQVNRQRLLVGNSKGGEKCKTLGSICTDLWRFCAVDRAEFENRAGKTTEQYQKEYHDRGCWPTIVRAKVKPGVYSVSSRYHLAKDNDVYSVIQWIGEL